MRLLLNAGILMAAIGSGCRPAAPAPPQVEGEPNKVALPPDVVDWKQIQGTWKIVESSRTGDAKDLEKMIRFENEHVTFVSKDGKADEQWRFGISTYASPKVVDLYKYDPANPPKKKFTSKGPASDPSVMPGIYELNGDQLVLLIDWAPGSEKRPASLDMKPEGKTVRFRLERVK